MVNIPEPKSKFLKVKCDDCGSEQVVFNSSAHEVNCLVCGKLLVTPGSSKAEILSKTIKPLG